MASQVFLGEYADDQGDSMTGRSKTLLVIFPQLNLEIFLKSSLPSNAMSAKTNTDHVFPT